MRVGLGRPGLIHDLDWTYQFDIRYCHLHGDVVGVQVPGAGHGIPLPVGLVYRGLAFPDPHRSHDPYPQGSVHPEFCLMACDADDLLHHGCRHLHSVQFIRQFDRLKSSSMDLLSMAGRHSAVLLRIDTMA